MLFHFLTYAVPKYDHKFELNSYEKLCEVYIVVWEQRKLQEIAEVSTGKAFKSSKFDKYGKFEVITNKNVQDIKNNIHTQGDRINIENSDTLKAYRLSGENILVTMDGVNIGKVGKFSNNKAVLAQRVGRIKSKYINFTYQILSDDKFLNLMNKVSVGNAIKHISLQQIAEYSLFAPSDEKEILKVGSILNNVDLTIASNQREYIYH
ncbi:restriction endonuclease subunit S [Paucilactobacillus nenjiangensis]|uniref:Type I restriction modification DNA specificity domain-containing protein n=1 Tax=Paucilactobacillus nenjiangensis TaxID=1296540 RepID=A0A5P1X5C7_9LACO|nr:restriction endonuclease subunit S [Paucilactobacillus nenjiangensis]QER67498.1 hypothetical protein F0161_06265 [Paucilactobacillus nenjiangensis]